MEYLEDEDIEVTPPSDFLEDDQIEVVPPSTLLQKVGTGLAQNAEQLAPAMEGSQSLLESLGTSALDTARGIGKGLTLNSIDEVGGALSAGAESLYNKFNPTDAALREQGFDIAQPSLGELYTPNQQAIQSELEMSAERSPVLDFAGQIGGGVASGSVIGSALGLNGAAQASRPLLDIAKNDGKIRAGIELLKRGGTSYAKALPAIAAEGALSSKEGNVLTEEGRSKLAEDTVGAALFGIPAVLGLQGLTDVAAPVISNVIKNIPKNDKGIISQTVQDYMKDSDLLRQMKKGYQYGEQNINPKDTTKRLATDLDKINLGDIDNSRINKLMDEIYRADDKIGKAVGESIEKATQKGVTVDITGDTQQSLSQLQNLAAKYPELSNNTRVNQIYAKIASDGGRITPSETQELIKYVDSYADKLQGTQDIVQKEILRGLLETRKTFSNTLKAAVPEYADAAARMTSFRKSIPETLIAREKPVDIAGNYFGNLKNKNEKLYDSLAVLLTGTTKPGVIGSNVEKAYVNTIKGMKKFELEEAGRLANGKINASVFERPVDEIGQEIIDAADDAVVRGTGSEVSSATGIGGVVKSTLFGFGRGSAINASYLVGRYTPKIPSVNVANPVARLGRNIYNAPDDAVKLLATTLEQTKGLERYGKQLTDSINSGNSNKRNQALFTIMQNPAARAVVGTDEEEN